MARGAFGHGHNYFDHPRSYYREDTVFEPIHYLPLSEKKVDALDQAAPLARWELPAEFPVLRRLMEARLLKAGRRDRAGVPPLVRGPWRGCKSCGSWRHSSCRPAHGGEDFAADGPVGSDAVKHLVLCQVERRPPRLDLDVSPYLPRADVGASSTASYMCLVAGGAA